MLPQLIFRGPILWENFQDNVYTSLSLQDVIELAWYMKDISRDNITTGVIDYQYMQNWEAPNGAQVLILDQGRIGNLMIQVFGSDYLQ